MKKEIRDIHSWHLFCRSFLYSIFRNGSNLVMKSKNYFPQTVSRQRSTSLNYFCLFPGEETYRWTQMFRVSKTSCKFRFTMTEIELFSHAPFEKMPNVSRDLDASLTILILHWTAWNVSLTWTHNAIISTRFSSPVNIHYYIRTTTVHTFVQKVTLNSNLVPNHKSTWISWSTMQWNGTNWTVNGDRARPHRSCFPSKFLGCILTL